MEDLTKKVTGESEVVKMADNKEIGRIGQRRYGGVIYEEFLHELRGKRGIEAYREMSENDDVVGFLLSKCWFDKPIGMWSQEEIVRRILMQQSL